MPYERSRELVSRNNSQLLVIDVQEKLIPAIPVRELLIDNCCKLIQAAKLFDAPVSATEQYAKGLGPTIPQLRKLLGGVTIPDKDRFSAVECLSWRPASVQPNARFQVVIAGLEAHVCVLQTALDLMTIGYQVFIPADAVASRTKLDWNLALRRLSASGAIITSTESVMFEWCEASNSPVFKQLSQVVKGSTRPPSIPNIDPHRP